MYYIFPLFLIILQGTPTPIQPHTSTIPQEITYENTVAPIVQNYCTTCHSGNDPSGGFVLTSYEAVRKEAEEGHLLLRINDRKDPMPQGGLLPKKLRVAIAEWARTGYKKGEGTLEPTEENTFEFIPPEIIPVDINIEGFDLLTQMQGHWIGEMEIMREKYSWFSFDYRPISASHIHGIFEGGTMGNLLTSFFITDFKGKRTIMARNGGLLNGIYRTSYFVLDEVKISADKSYYRLVDAFGGKGIMWMELEFSGDNLEFNSYTSRFGTHDPPRRHMHFKAKRNHTEFAEAAAQKLDFPKNVVDKELPNPMPTPVWGAEYPTITSASYIWKDATKDLVTLGTLAKDPYRIDQLPYLSELLVTVERNAKIQNEKLLVYLSKDPLTDENGKFFMEYGYIKQTVFDGIFLFPEISAPQTEFTFSYLHPGNYYLTVVADLNKDGYASSGDISHPSIFVAVKPKSKQKVEVVGVKTDN